MLKRFILIIAVAQAVITLLHLGLYFCTVFFFPMLGGHRALWILITVLLSVSFLATTIISFKFNNPLVRFLYHLSSIWMGAMFYFGIATVISLVTYIVAAGVTSTQNFWKFALALDLVAFGLVLYGTINKWIIRVTNIELELPNTPASWKGRLAVMVSDPHLGHIQMAGFSKRLTRLIREIQPEIVFIPGDFFDGGVVDFENLLEPFRSLNIKHGIYFVSGNHDKYPDDPKTLRAISAAGIKVIDEQMLEIEGVQIIGVGYYSQETVQTLRDKLQKMQLNRDKPAILLKHVPIPEHLEVAKEHGIHLQLSGHTHRGQVYPFRHITRKIFNGFDYGLKRLENLWVYTSSGVGTWGPPLRIGTRSEIVKIRFK